jgi:hypothetical protein
MEVFIDYASGTGFYICDTYGNPVCARWFTTYIAAENFCGEQGWTLVGPEYDDD